MPASKTAAGATTRSAAHFAAWHRDTATSGLESIRDTGVPNTVSSAAAAPPSAMFSRGNPTGVSAAATLSEGHEPDVPPLLLAAPFVVLHDQLLADAERLRELDPASSASVVYERIAARVSAAIRSAAHGETFVTTTEAATLLGVGRSAVVARITRKRMAAVKRNHKWLIDRRTLEALL